MFQSYDDISEKDQSAGRIAALRAWLADNGLDGFILHRGDEFQGEYVAAYAGRLSWLTGFTGSAGVVIVLKDKAAIFVDGRYTIQVKEQTDDSVLTALDVTSEPPAKWLAKNVSAGEKIAFDPWLLTTAQVEKYQKQAQSANARLVAVDHNPVDAIWTDQPARPSGKIFTQPIELAGRAAHEKIAGIQKQLNDKKAKAVVLTLSDSVSWLFNIRGSEIAHNPVVLAFAIVPESGKAQLFLDAAKVPDEVHKQLERTTTIEPPENFAPALARLAGSGAAIMVDPDHAASAIITLIEENGGAIIRASDPCILPKACKNEAELNGARAAHRRDGAVMARFLSWLAETAPDGGLDEVAVAKKLEALRAETGKLRDISFDTISAAGPHAAIPHYRVTTSTSLPLEMNRIYLVDSGAQYEDGTTDITRTVITGTPTAQMKDRFTRVLKGMINLTLARFPEGTNGAQLDILARQSLWQAGLDFDHGTGHGVGSYLSVHEGPARISKAGHVALKPGMILSNEPGYYKQDDYGIRIENLCIVTPATPVDGGERPMHGFETLTLAPIDRNLIAPEMLNAKERAWLNAYHARVLKEIGPLVDDKTLNWLKQATAEI